MTQLLDRVVKYNPEMTDTEFEDGFRYLVRLYRKLSLDIMSRVQKTDPEVLRNKRKQLQIYREKFYGDGRFYAETLNRWDDKETRYIRSNRDVRLSKSLRSTESYVDSLGKKSRALFRWSKLESE